MTDGWSGDYAWAPLAMWALIKYVEVESCGTMQHSHWSHSLMCVYREVVGGSSEEVVNTGLRGHSRDWNLTAARRCRPTN